MRCHFDAAFEAAEDLDTERAMSAGVQRQRSTLLSSQPQMDRNTIPLPVNLSVMICRYAATCWGNPSCSHGWFSSPTLKMPSAFLPVGLPLIPLGF